MATRWFGPFFSAGSRRGSSSTELALMTSIVIISCACAGYLFIPGFASGVLGMGHDVQTMLSTGQIGGAEAGGSSPGSGSAPGGGPYSEPGPDVDDGSAGGDTGGDSGGDGGSPDDGAPEEGGDGGDDGAASGDSGPEEPPPAEDGGDDEEDTVTCPYVYDEASGRWRDPETGQCVSGAAASSAGC